MKLNADQIGQIMAINHPKPQTERERVLEAIATNMLRKAKFYPRKQRVRDEYVPVDAESVGANGNLRPTWQGRP